MNRLAKTSLDRKLPIGFLHSSEWNAMDDEQKKDYCFKHGSPVNGCNLVITSLSYERINAQIANLHQKLIEKERECAANKDEYSRNIAKLEQLQRNELRGLEDAQRRELCVRHTETVQWRDRFSAAKAFIAILLKGDEL